MSTFNRYCLHFGIIGIVFLIAILILISADGGKLVIPEFVMTIIMIDLCFIFFMSLLFSNFAKPKTVFISTNQELNIDTEFKTISEKKWKRKKVVKEDDVIKFEFGNKYKDWLATPIEFKKVENGYKVIIPSCYEEDLINYQK